METNHTALSWKLTSPTALLTLVLGAFMLFLSINTTLHPLSAGQGFGIPSTGADALPWLSVKAGRDLGIALALFGLVFTRQRLAAGVFVLATIVMPVVDALTVVRAGTSLTYALCVHGSAALFGVLLGAALLRGRTAVAP